ncbi:unnamed protein product [Closterium sp. NIES-64]|nr:unnamed protein product [Closterium sp. NIES-64]
MYAVTTSVEGDCYLCVPPDPGIEATALGAGEAAALGASASSAPGASASAAPGAGESALSAPTGTLSGLYLPSFSTNLGHERYFLIVVDDYSRYTTVFPLRSNGDVTEVLIDWIRAARLQLRESFGSDFPVQHLHSDRGGEFSSARLGAFCRANSIRQTFTLPASPQQNGIAERRIGMVMDVARTSMMHAAAPHFLWPFAVQYAAHQLNLQPRVSLPETSPTLRWTGKVGDASAFRVWGSRAFVRDLSADKLSPRAVPCVFFGFPPDARGWQFYHPTSRCVLSSQDVTFDESVPYYRLFPYRTAPLPPPPLFLAPGPPPVDPLPPQGPAPPEVLSLGVLSLRVLSLGELEVLLLLLVPEVLVLAVLELLGLGVLLGLLELVLLELLAVLELPVLLELVLLELLELLELELLEVLALVFLLALVRLRVLELALLELEVLLALVLPLGVLVLSFLVLEGLRGRGRTSFRSLSRFLVSRPSVVLLLP